jgi:hypothetical protein
VTCARFHDSASYLKIEMRTISTIIFLMLHLVAGAREYHPLTGSYSIGGKTFYDAPDSEPNDTHIYFNLTGPAAKDLFESMKAKPIRDECIDDGSLTKRIKEMQCTQSADRQEHRCWFGIDVKKQRITNGVVC